VLCVIVAWHSICCVATQCPAHSDALCSHGNASSYAPHVRMRNIIIGKQKSEALSATPSVYNFTVYTST